MTYTEDNLTEQPAIQLFESLGWQTLNCFSESFGEDGLLGRDNHSELSRMGSAHHNVLLGIRIIFDGRSPSYDTKKATIVA